jgi:Animal haem peroxidase
VLRRRSERPTEYRDTPFWRLFDRVSETLDRQRGWHQLPTPLGLVVLVGIRNILRRRNLYDTDQLPSVNVPPVPAWRPEYRTQRTADGTYNDLDRPAMGRAGSRFGRNVPLGSVGREPVTDILEPNPRTVSLELLTRHQFEPATTLNALAAAWLQFMIKDWISHGHGPSENPWRIPLSEGDEFPDKPMLVPRTPRDFTRPEGEAGIPTFINYESPWWDGSQLYGASLEAQRMVRSGTGGKLRVGLESQLPYPTDPEIDPRQVPGFWLGLSLFSRIFVLEHNAICDRLKQSYPMWSDEELFQHARLINAALLAKIHTVEWTPAIISHPTTVIAMHANWYGLAGTRITNTFGRLSSSEVISGIPGSETNHFGVPYSLTEEFTSVYRMHPLITDDWTFRSLKDHHALENHPFRELTGQQITPLEERVSLADLIYSFGHTHPGAIQLHNYPRDLQNFVRPDGKRVDLAATDILRSRELGVPRYNEFRRLLHLKPAATFEALTSNQQWAKELRRVYGNVEKVDLTVGLFAEPLPKGFAFSDTAFRIFIVMASRRLNSDRFFTMDFTPRVYTEVGMKWIRDGDLSSVLLRHCPELAPALRGLPHGFAPFNPATSIE